MTTPILTSQAKAIVAGAATAVATALTAYFTGTDELTWKGLLAAVLAGLVGYAGTYRTKNTVTPAPRHTTWPVREAGRADLLYVLAVVVLVLLVVVLGAWVFDFSPGGR